MRIAHVTDCYLPRLGGIELQVHDLARRQAAVHDVTVITTTAGTSCSERVALDVDHDGVKVIRIGRPEGRSRLAWVGLQGGLSAFGEAAAVRRRGPEYRRGGPEYILYRWSPQVRAALDGGNFDVVHVHASSFSPLAFVAAHHASRAGVPTVATVHSMWAKATPLFRGAHTLTGWGRWPVVWSAVSNAAAEPLRAIAGRHAPVAILPNGVDASEWRVRHVPGPPDVLRVAAVSRLASRKRVMQLVRALAEARARIPSTIELHVEILGDGPQRAQIEQYLADNGMAGWVHLQGRRSRAEIRSVLARSDVFVAPAVLESFGIAALEARCAGLPIIARSGTGVQDFVADGREGWLVDSDSAMADMLVTLARSRDMLERAASHNRTVAASIDWSVVDVRCEALYQQASLRHGRSWSQAGLDSELPVVAKLSSAR